MSGVDELITATLHGRAAKDVDSTALLHAARERGGRYRSRQRIQLSAAAVALSVLAVAAGSFLWQGAEGAPQLATGSATRPATALPPAPEQPAAADDPGRVGQDPNLLHFDAPAITAAARHYTWTSGEGYEQLWAGLGEEDFVDVSIGHDMAVLDAVPREGAQVPRTVIREEPVPGLLLRVQASDEELAREVAEAVELHHSQRVVLPFQLSALPDAAEPVLAYVGFSGGTYSGGGVVLRHPNGATLEVQAQSMPRGAGSGITNHVIAGRKAFIYPGGDEVALTEVPNLDLSVRIGIADQGFALSDADTILGGITLAADLERMTTWPATLIVPS